MPHPSCILFDYGGTLDDDGRHWPVRWHTHFEEAGASVPRDAFLTAFSRIDAALPSAHDLRRAGLGETASLLGADLARELTPGRPEVGEKAAEAFLASSRRFLRRNRALLESLKARFRLGIVSNFYGNLDAVLASEGLDPLFDAVADSARVGASKPDRRIFEWALQRLGAAPREALMVGDSPPADLRGAEALGMPHAWLAGPRPDAAPCCAGTPVLQSLLDLSPLLFGKPPAAAGIIAAGLGERMRGSHPGLPKPLVPVGGKPLVLWVARALFEAGVERLTVLFNSRGREAREELRRAFPGKRIDFLEADTPTSFASFRLVAKTLGAREERFLMSTVDALVPPAEVRRFAAEAFAPGPGPAPRAAVALTRFVDDEKPLWAELSGDGTVAAFGDSVSRRETVTCGLYALTREAAAALPESAPRLRDFWTGLAASGAPVRGVVLSDTVDVDRPEDIPAAERLISCFGA